VQSKVWERVRNAKHLMVLLPRMMDMNMHYSKICDIRYWIIKKSLLTFQSLAVTLHTTRFNIKKFCVVPTLRLCVLYRSQNKQQLLPYKTLRDWFL
jgi:hypothetical protein